MLKERIVGREKIRTGGGGGEGTIVIPVFITPGRHRVLGIEVDFCNFIGLCCCVE